MLSNRWFSFLSLLAVAAFVLVATLPNVYANPSKFQELLKAARKEAAQGSFLVYASNPKKEKTRRALFDAFKKKFNFPDLTYEWIPLFPSAAVPRVITELKAGRSGPTVIMTSTRTAFALDDAGAIERFDWEATFSRQFRDIKEVAFDQVSPELRGKWVRIYDGPRSFVFNTKMIKSSEVPDDIADLTDPKWSHRFVMPSRDVSAFRGLSLRRGEEWGKDLLRKIIANKPIFVTSTPSVNVAVAAGQAPVGLGSIHESERLKRFKGAPIDWKTYGEYIPVSILGYTVTKNSPQPNLGRLFIAWFATEGIDIFEELELSTRVTRKGSFLNKMIQKRVPNAKLIIPVDRKEVERANAIDKKLRAIIAEGVGGR